MPTRPTMAPIERSTPPTSSAKDCPSARMATNENPESRFSTFVALANRGAAALKNAATSTANAISANLVLAIRIAPRRGSSAISPSLRLLDGADVVLGGDEIRHQQ